MRFWDSSALVPLVIRERRSQDVAQTLEEDPEVVTWWATQVECANAIARLGRQRIVADAGQADLRNALWQLALTWTEIEPSEEVRQGAMEVVRLYPLRAADALQLSAARVWAGGRPTGQAFVCLDNRLREAAMRDGFRVLPER